MSNLSPSAGKRFARPWPTKASADCRYHQRLHGADGRAQRLPGPLLLSGAGVANASYGLRRISA